MRHGSLFSGIGGFDLASEWMGWENVFHCEWNEFGQKVLKYYWPKSITYNDITKTDFTIHRGTIDILTGGFPCQPYSSAGKRLGKEDERHLWPEMLRTIRQIQPTWVVGENVRGLTNWNGGLVFDEVQADLEAEGYEVTPFLLPACAVNAPHRRDRIWFIAYSKSNDAKRIREFNNNKWQNKKEKRFGFWNEFTSNGSESIATNSNSSSKESPGKSRSFNCDRSDNNAKQEQRRESTKQYIGCNNVSGDVKHSDSFGQEWRSNKTDGKIAIRNFFGKSNARINKWNAWQNFPTVSPICDGNDGLSSRLDGITFSKWRNESIKAGGNAIVPQVVFQIFKAIEQYNQLNNQLTL
jgi:DNA (cytosine-5)-methyltransferase 1